MATDSIYKKEIIKQYQYNMTESIYKIKGDENMIKMIHDWQNLASGSVRTWLCLWA